ncbi:ferrous iron transport protein B [candidate division KSB1 bacterium]|nr:ferrous iron transport protein B [candidate division KSB1 bacterium]
MRAFGNKIKIKEDVKTIRIALAGNPNSGKTSLFNALTGQVQHVGNYPGVTVEKKIGRIRYKGKILEFVDLPGTYSLTAFSIEEIVTRDYVLQEKPDVVIDVIDSTNLERNLYLCLQFQELGVPVIGALNMTDEAENLGIHIDEKQLGRILGIPFVKTIGTRGSGKEMLLDTALQVAEGEIISTARHLNYGLELESQHYRLIDVLKTDPEFGKKYALHWMAIKLMENDREALKKIASEHSNADLVLQQGEIVRSWIEKHFGEDSEVVVCEQRYAYIHGACREVVKHDSGSERIDFTEMVDKVVLNRYLGLIIFFGIMFLIYHLTFNLGNPLSDGIDRFFVWLQDVLVTFLPAGIFRDFLVEGIIGGVGGVLVFFPIVLLLFLGLSFLEDTGYMARAAFVMDKFMHLFGLHGRSFIPMMVSTGCAVPGIMSARTLVNPKDRVLTIFISPLMMCGAKTPVIAMLAAAFFPEHAGTVFWSLWFFGWLLALSIAKLFRHVIYRGEVSPFVMELPPYRMPTIRGVITHVWEKSWAYVKKAGTFILAASVIIWFVLSFPKPHHIYEQHEQAQQQLDSQLQSVAAEENSELLIQNIQDKKDSLDAALAERELKYGMGGRFGQFIEPVFRTCGFDWRMDIALFAGIAAKEVIISTMGIVYGIGETNVERENGNITLKEKLENDPRYNPRKILAFMIFVLIYVPCMATLAVVKKELGSWKYPLFMAGYTLVLAWILAASVYQISRVLGIGG